MHLYAQAGMMLGVPGWTAGTFRDYYVPDQLAYLAIATDWSAGTTASLEPFTETGSIYYPRLYYQFLGTVARLTGSTAATAWTVVGLTVQVLLVVAIGLTAVLLTRRWWAGLLGFVPFVVGTLANLRYGGDTWFWQQGAHAVLWGPFASVFTLNGDNTAMALGTMAVLALILVAAGRIRGRAAVTVAVAACVVVGGLSAVQTYSFLIVSYAIAAAGAAWGLWHHPRRRPWLVATAALLVLLFAAGDVVLPVTGPLVLLVLAMTPALPGLFLLWRQVGRTVLFAVLGYGLAAAPQVVLTLAGILGGDAFLSFRTGNANDLSVRPLDGLVAAGPVLLPLVLILVAGLRRREPLWVAVAGGGAAAWFVAATNDLWGADQEPYRMYLNSFALLAAVAVPVGSWVLVRSWSGRVRGTPPRRRLLVAATVAVAGLVAAAFPDFLLWRSHVTGEGYVAFDTPQLTAAVQVLERVGDEDGLVLAGPCLDPLLLKPAWTGRVAHFNRGLAWPDTPAPLYVLGKGIGDGFLDPRLARASGVRWVLTDTACDIGLMPSPLTFVAAVDYAGPDGAGAVRLWSLDAA
ncbi:hypothetical protein [Nakamurella deserti]|uniref:hypothetical protein n=1 Tax=Nakamurella deserti TaxID=2164074 RepID=UPI000DBE3366|nr:hypothetical protein [Nakamurella deserti]